MTFSFFDDDGTIIQGGRDAVRDMKPGDAILSVLLEQEMRDTPIPSGVTHKLVPIPDRQPFPVGALVDAALWVKGMALRREGGDGKVLIHCAEGNSRSIAVVLILLLESMSLAAAIDKICYVKPHCTEGGKCVNEKQEDRINAWGDFTQRLMDYFKGVRIFRQGNDFVVFHLPGENK